MLVDIVNEQIKTEKVCICVINSLGKNKLLDSIDKRVVIKSFSRKTHSRNIIPLINLNIFLIQYHPDIVHCHVENIASIIPPFFKKVLTVHNTHCYTPRFRKFDGIFCISEAVKAYVNSHGITNGQLIYNGIHTKEVVHKEWNDNHASTNKKVSMICVGRLHKDKGQNIIIEAFNELINNNFYDNVSIDLVGDGPERIRWEHLVEKYNLIPYIHFTGEKSRDYIYQHLCEYDLFVLPSITEGFGLTVAEACAAKLPVIVADLPGPMEVIGGGRWGSCFKAGDYMSLVHVLKSFLETGPDSLMIENAYHFVVKNFDVEETAKKYLEEYKEVLNN